MPEIPEEAMQREFEAPVQNTSRQINEAVCIDTARVYDSCADKDCIANLRVYFNTTDQRTVGAATTIRCRGCEVVNVFSEIEKVPFNTGYYSVDNTFYFRVLLDVYSGPYAQPQTVSGLCVFSKKSILYGSEGSVKVFSSEYEAGAPDTQSPSITTNPRAKIQVATPICLDARFCRLCDCVDNITDPENGIPEQVKRVFGGDFKQENAERAVRVTLGLFTILQLERDVQMLIPAYDFCMPTKECADHTEDPCEAFNRISFPVNEFFPPESFEADSASGLPDCGCAK